MMEQGIGFNVLADFRGQVQLELGDLVDNLVHFVGILIEGHQAVLNFHQIMALLKNTGEHGGSDELFGAVNRLGLGNEGLPFLGTVDDIGYLQVLLPVFDVFNHNFVGGVNGERAGSADGPGTGDAPCVHNVMLTQLGAGIMHAKGSAKLQGKRFILIDKAVGMPAMNGFQKILTLC